MHEHGRKFKALGWLLAVVAAAAVAAVLSGMAVRFGDPMVRVETREVTAKVTDGASLANVLPGDPETHPGTDFGQTVGESCPHVDLYLLDDVAVLVCRP